MKQILSDSDRTLLDKHIAETEKQTGAQIVLASIMRSDSYAEIPWKAFAFGAPSGNPSTSDSPEPVKQTAEEIADATEKRARAKAKKKKKK